MKTCWRSASSAGGLVRHHQARTADPAHAAATLLLLADRAAARPDDPSSAVPNQGRPDRRAASAAGVLPAAAMRARTAAAETAGEQDVVAGGQPGQQVEELEHEADVVGAEARAHPPTARQRLPATSTVPARGWITPPTSDSSVVLPLPLGLGRRARRRRAQFIDRHAVPRAAPASDGAARNAHGGRGRGALPRSQRASGRTRR